MVVICPAFVVNDPHEMGSTGDEMFTQTLADAGFEAPALNGEPIVTSTLTGVPLAAM
jgi:hypothetical protein